MKFRDLHPNIRLRIFETFFSDIIGGMILPFMAIYFAQKLGAEVTGLLLTLNVIAGIIASFYGGYISDKIGRKKLWAISEYTRFISSLVMALVNIPNISSVHNSALITIAMFLLINICMGFSGPAASAMLIDVSTSSNRGFMYSITFWANNCAAAIGSLLGGFLFEKYLYWLFGILAIANLISAIVVSFFITETYKPVANDNEDKTKFSLDIIQKYKTVLKDRTFVLFTLAYLLIISLEFQLPNYIAIKLNHYMPNQNLLPFLDFKINGVNIFGILRAENTIIIAVLIYFINKIVRNYKSKHVWILGFTLYSIGYVVVSYSNNASILILFMLIASIGELMYISPHKSYLAMLPPENLRSSYLAVNDLVIRLSYLIAYLCIAASVYLTPILMTTLFFCMAAVGLFIFAKILPVLEKKEQQLTKDTA